jgi:hypothetical protein
MDIEEQMQDIRDGFAELDKAQDRLDNFRAIRAMVRQCSAAEPCVAHKNGSVGDREACPQ